MRCSSDRSNPTLEPGAGFTIIELMVVVAIIAIIAAVALPNLLASRLSANESSAISTLRTISSAQAQAKNRVAVDVDGDGNGEFLYLAELSGIANLRGTAAPLDPAAVSVALGLVNASAVNKSGYHFALYLPDAAGAGVAEDAAGGKAVAAAVDADFAESIWVCYAWPADNGSSGRRVFAINESGDLIQTNNQAQGYSGVGAGATTPAPDAAYSAASLDAGFSLRGQPAPAQDGGTWTNLN